MTDVAIYARLSQQDGTKESVADQVERCTRYAAEHWPGATVATFTDDGISGTRSADRRPGYRQLLEAIAGGRVQAVITRDQSRISREGAAGWERFRVACTDAGISRLHTLHGGEVALAAHEALSGDIVALVDRDYIEKNKQKCLDALDRRVRQGRPAGGKVFGFHRVTDDNGQKQLEPDAELVPIVANMANRVLRGDALAAIARDLEAAGVPTARGGKWAPTTVRSVLTSPTIAGLRSHKGEVVGEGTWPAILDRSTWEQVRAALAAPVTVTRSDGATYRVTRRRAPARRYLLTGGLSLCAKCGGPLVAQQRRNRDGSSRPVYLCVSPGCYGVGILAEPLEAHVVKEVLDALNTDKVRAALAAGDDHAEERQQLLDSAAAIEGRRVEAATAFARGDIDVAMLSAVRDQLDAEAGRITAELDALPQPTAGLDPDAVITAWDGLTLTERRQTIALIVTAVVVGPAQPGAKRFDRGRVTISWAWSA